jgi:hypothetical protein
MWPLSPALAAVLADALLALHLGVVAFVVLGEVGILLGARRGWRWVRGRGWRLAHLLLMGFIAVQAALGRLCPLTLWEQGLRAQAGQATHGDSFIAHWLGRLLYWELPWWVFVVTYAAFALLVSLTWRWVPPVRR